ncbi:hypothetical protein ACK8GE_08730 [Micromonosporaceae bacterium DT194]|uniref:hypothetical protein n=1 Tax=Melissospora conviva TaxID=3388432 RepID=UPI003C1BCDDE
MIKLATRVLPIAAAIALLTACSTAEAETPVGVDSPAAAAPEETAASAAGPATFPNCDQIAALIGGRLQGYALEEKETVTEPDQTECAWYHTTELVDGVNVSYSRQFDAPDDFPMQRDIAQRMHGANYVEDALLDGCEAYMFKLDGGITNTMSYVSAYYQINFVLVGGAVKSPPTAAEMVGLADLVTN